MEKCDTNTAKQTTSAHGERAVQMLHARALLSICIKMLRLFLYILRDANNLLLRSVLRGAHQPTHPAATLPAAMYITFYAREALRLHHRRNVMCCIHTIQYNAKVKVLAQGVWVKLRVL
jgi:hypothetical protein